MVKSLRNFLIIILCFLFINQTVFARQLLIHFHFGIPYVPNAQNYQIIIHSYVAHDDIEEELSSTKILYLKTTNLNKIYSVLGRKVINQQFTRYSSRCDFLDFVDSLFKFSPSDVINIDMDDENNKSIISKISYFISKCR